MVLFILAMYNKSGRLLSNTSNSLHNFGTNGRRRIIREDKKKFWLVREVGKIYVLSNSFGS